MRRFEVPPAQVGVECPNGGILKDPKRETPVRSICLVAAVFAAGCVLHPVPGALLAPSAQLSASEEAIARAVAAGAAELAPVELAAAREKLALSRRWVEAADYEPARWLAAEAQVDAELAAAKAALAASGARR
jgi:hypothetical protein